MCRFISHKHALYLALLLLSQVRSAIRAVTTARVGLPVPKTARLVSRKYSGDFNDVMNEVFPVHQLVNAKLPK